MVEYRGVPGIPGYRVGDDASVWSNKRKSRWSDGERDGEWKRMKYKKHKRGEYIVVTLCHEGKSITFLLHRLVLLCFVGPPPSDEHLGLHRNDDKTNNTPNNLYWGTHQENMEDAKRNGKVTGGERNGCVKLMEEQVKEIVRLRAEEGIGSRRLARMFGVHHTTIQAVLSGTNWSHLQVDRSTLITQGDTIRGDKNPAAKLNKEQVDMIRWLAGTMSQAKIAGIYGVHQTAISAIIQGKNW